MNWLTDQFLFNYFLVFCRIGIAFGLMPALGGTRYPPMVRLLFAMGVSLSLTPLVSAAQQFPAMGDSDKLRAILFELIAGFLIGFWCSCFIYILRFAGAFVVNMIGLAGIPGQPIDEAEARRHRRRDNRRDARQPLRRLRKSSTSPGNDTIPARRRHKAAGGASTAASAGTRRSVRTE